MIIIAISSFLVIFLGGNYAIYRMIVYAFGLADYSGLLWVKGLFFVSTISFPLLMFLTSKGFTSVGKVLYAGSAVWLGTLYWLSLAMFIFGVIYSINYFISPTVNLAFVARTFIFLAIGVSVFGVWNSYQIKVKTTTVFLDNLPSTWEDKKIVLFSDTHFGNMRNVNFAKKVVSVINDQKPDAVLIAGDFFDGPPVLAGRVTNPFTKLQSTHGAYIAPGNHEEYGDRKQFLESLESAGIHVLGNKKEVVDGLQIVGIDYSSTKNPADQEKVLTELNIDPNVASILIKHEPANIAVAEKFSIGLQVSGHTHKGQVFPISILTKRMYGKFYYGLNRLEKTQVYTTSGVGTWGPPQRVGTDSEIVVIHLKKSI